jgi:hypothetical protein
MYVAMFLGPRELANCMIAWRAFNSGEEVWRLLTEIRWPAFMPDLLYRIEGDTGCEWTFLCRALNFVLCKFWLLALLLGFRRSSSDMKALSKWHDVYKLVFLGRISCRVQVGDCIVDTSAVQQFTYATFLLLVRGYHYSFRFLIKNSPAIVSLQ